ncbi:MAG: nucleotidyltransferase family protein [Thermodesulfobacteriota bacterium]
MSTKISVPKQKVADFCRRNRIRRLSFFGSVLRDDFRPESDVDVLVEFEPDARVGMIGLTGMELELGEILGRRVELHTSRGLNPHFRNEVLERAEGIHGRSLLQPTQCRRSLLPRR